MVTIIDKTWYQLLNMRFLVFDSEQGDQGGLTSHKTFSF